MTIAERVAGVRARIAAAAARSGRSAGEITLVAVSKRHPPSAVRDAFAAGVRDFGENYTKELLEKQAALADLDARWHFVGRLQRNKAKDVVGRVALLHAVDGAALAEAISRRAEGTVGLLVQVNLSGEATKGGVAPAELAGLLAAIAPLPHLRCTGLMTMPPPVDDPEQNRRWFRALADLARAHSLRELSMGMSDDFEVAIEEGATLVRVGTALFGERPES